MTELILATGGRIAVAAYISAIVVLTADEVVRRSTALAAAMGGRR